MPSFLHPAQSPARLAALPPVLARARAAAPARQARSFWHRPAHALRALGSPSGATQPLEMGDEEMAARLLVCRSEAFAEDLGPAYAAVSWMAAARS